MKKIYMLLAGALLWTAASFAQNGDSCTVALEITTDGDYTVEALTGTGAIESGATAAAWYFYTATAHGTINISSCASDIDSRLFVYTGECGALVSYADDDDGCGDDDANTFASVLTDVDVMPGTTYYIAWDDRWSGDGFTFNFEFVPLTNGDSCSVAKEIMGNGSYPVADLTGSGAIEDGATAAAWYFYTATADGTINISSCASDNDSRLFVYTGDCGALVSYANDDDGCGDDDASTFASLLTDVPVDSGTTYYIAWDDRWSASGFMFDFEFVLPPSCADVTGLSAFDITASQASVNWNSDGNTSWDVVVDTAGFDVDAATPTTVTDTFITVLALEAETVYDAYVRTNCTGDGLGVSEWTMISFTTECVPEVMTIPYSEDYEGVTVPDMPCGWLVNNINGDDFTWETIVDNGSNIMSVRWNSAMAMDDMTKTPELALTGGTSYTLRFDLRTGSTFFVESLAVFYAGDDGVAVDTLINMVDFGIVDWEIKQVEFIPPADGNYRIAFYGTSMADQLRIRIDNVSVVETPDCTPPLSVTMSDITDNSATASWDNVGPDYQIVWDTAGFDPAAVIAVDVMDTTYDILGLDPETDYEAYVRSNCGAGVFSPWVMASFTTNGLPPGNDNTCDAWDLVVDGDTVVVDNTDATFDGDSASCWGNYNNGDVWLKFDFVPAGEITGVEIVTEAGTSNDSHIALYSVDGCPDGPLTLTELGCDEDGGDGFMSYISPTFLEAGTYYIQCAAWTGAEGTYGVAVHGVNVPEPPVNDNCDGAVAFDLPVDGSTVSVTGDGTGATNAVGFPAAQVWESFTISECANVTIDFCGSVDQATALFIILYDACPIGDPFTDQGVVGDADCGVPNLKVDFTAIPAGTYWYPVVADPGFGGFTAYTMNITAVACPSCMPVTNLAVTVDGLTATATWDDIGDAYELVYGLAGFDPDAETPIDVAEATYDITGLEASTAYEVYVRNNCGADDVSTWVMAAFSTAGADEGEGFENDFPPVGWSMIDADGDGNNWLQYEFDPYAGNFSAASESFINGVGPLTPDNYLITPPRHITEGNAEISWHVAAQDPAYPSDLYGLWVSTTGNEEGDFTTELFVETLTTDAWEERFVDLSDYIGQDIYLAFRHYNSTDWFVMKIDNVILPGIAVGVNEAENIDFAIYPNPNSGQFSIANKGVTGDYLIEIIDVTGKVVYSENQTLNSGARTVINPDNVNMGVYMVKLTNTQENYYRTQRMIIK